mgnify:CR=1 FL=1
MLDWLLAPALAMYLLYEARRGRLNRAFLKFAILLAYAGLLAMAGPAPLVGFPNTQWESATLTLLGLGFLCSVNAGFQLPTPMCVAAEASARAIGALPMLLALYQASALITWHWPILLAAGALAYIADEDSGLAIMAIPAVAYLIAHALHPLASLLTPGLGSVFVEAFTSGPTAYYTGPGLFGFTNSTAYGSRPLEAAEVVYLWLRVNYTESTQCTVLHRFGDASWAICTTYIGFKPPNTVECPAPCGAWAILWSNGSLSVVGGLGRVTIVLKPTVEEDGNRTIVLNTAASIWAWARGIATNCTAGPDRHAPNYPTATLNTTAVAYANSLLHQPYILPNSTAEGYRQDAGNYTTPNETCVVAIIGNSANQWVAKAPVAYTPYIAWAAWIMGRAADSTGFVGSLLKAGAVAVIFGVSIEALAMLGVFRRIISLLTRLAG